MSIRLKFGQSPIIQTDVASWASQINAFKSAINFAANGSIDVVVDVAGIFGDPTVPSQNESPSLAKDPVLTPFFDRVIDIIFKGRYLLAGLQYITLGYQRYPGDHPLFSSLSP